MQMNEEMKWAAFLMALEMFSKDFLEGERSQGIPEEREEL